MNLTEAYRAGNFLITPRIYAHNYSKLRGFGKANSFLVCGTAEDSAADVYLRNVCLSDRWKCLDAFFILIQQVLNCILRGHI